MHVDIFFIVYLNSLIPRSIEGEEKCLVPIARTHAPTTPRKPEVPQKTVHFSLFSPLSVAVVCGTPGFLGVVLVMTQTTCMYIRKLSLRKILFVIIMEHAY